MPLADFDFDLPPERIALHPAEPRDAARLLYLGREGAPIDSHIRDLPGFLRPGDLMVVNDTKVIPAQLFGRRGPLAVEITLLKPEPSAIWSALARPGRKLRPGDEIEIGPDFRLRLVEKRENGEIALGVAGSLDWAAGLDRYGRMPLPPYIRKTRPIEDRDAVDYQTIYARQAGAVAAPTAGLHFTDRLLARLRERGVEIVAVTLHVGAGTFLPVKAEDIAAHRLHAEYGEIAPEAAERINRAMAAGRRVLVIGTTSLRLLESAAIADKKLRPFAGETDIFIRPGFRFRIVDLLMTNFHLPRSTLFMLVAAFAGLDPIRAAYAHAIDTGYRFYSYGDASLLERASP